MRQEAVRLPEQDTHGIRAVQRAMIILEQLGRNNEASITELAKLTELHKSTVHRILVTLEAGGMVRQNPQNGHYRLGFKMMELGAQALRSVELRATAHPHMEELSRDMGLTVNLGVLDQSEVVYLDKIEGAGSFRFLCHVGSRAPFHCTAMGKVMVAALTPAEQRRLVYAKPLKRFTRRTITDPDKLMQHLALVAGQGWAMDDGEHNDLGHCVGVPLRDHAGKVVAAISMTTVCAELSDAERDRVLTSILRTAAAISSDLGYELRSPGTGY